MLRPLAGVEQPFLRPNRLPGWLAAALARVAKIVGSTGVATTMSMLARARDAGADYSER